MKRNQHLVSPNGGHLLEKEPRSLDQRYQARILVVDDEPALRHGVRFALETEGHYTEGAADAESALARLLDTEAPTFDLMITDLKMPEMSGIDLIAECASNNLFVPTILVSAHLDSVTAVRALDLGVTDFLRKPFWPTDIRGLLTKVIDEESNFRSGDVSEEIVDLVPGVSRARWSLRRRDVDQAIEVLLKTDEGARDVSHDFWLFAAEHLKACREGSDGLSTRFASSHFYGAADLLRFLAYNE